MSQSRVRLDARGQFAAAGFFALRTPLLPLTELLDWGAGLRSAAAARDGSQLEEALAVDRARLRGQLGALLKRPEVHEALFVASPSLAQRLSDWWRDPDSKSGQKVERIIVRYFVRMAARATPFGLFAGCSVGTSGTQTRLEIAGRDRCGRHTRLDMDYLSTLTEVFERDSAIRAGLTYRPNSSLYEAAGRLRYAEARLRKKVRSHHLVAVDVTDYLRATLARAAGGARPDRLARALVEADPEVSLEEATDYINELIDSQLLVSGLSPAITGPEPVHGIVETLADHPPAADAVQYLKQAHTSLQAIDEERLGMEPERYRAVARTLERLPAEIELSRLFQVDLIKPATAMLGPEVVGELIRGAETLHRLAGPNRQDPLARFRAEFVRRYEDQDVPLVEVLDEEVGIGFERSTAPTAEASPLLAGLSFPAAMEEPSLRWGPREAYLLRKLEELRPRDAAELSLTEEDLNRLGAEQAPPLPDAFAVMATLVGSEESLARDDFRVLLRNVAGPAGAQLLGRFCHADEGLRQHVKMHLRAEEALRPDAVFAEIVHLPEGRIGNIICRPVLRAHEIPFLGRSGVPAERQVPVSDLLVSIDGERVVLRSKRLEREIVPRLTNAHNYGLRSLGTYRFLCALQQQGVSPALGWSWGPLENARYLPRVTSGRLVLSRARWRVDREELRALVEASGTRRFAAVQTWRAGRKLPRWVAVADADNELLVDFDNVLSAETFIHLVKDRFQVRLTEVYPGPDELCVRGPEGLFVHELVVPFVRTREPSGRSLSPRRPAVTRAQRSFAPGSAWLYAKLYTGTSTADRILRDVLGPFAQEAVRGGAADRWFFIRYSDPDWHLRLRLCGDPARLQDEVWPRFREVVRPSLEHGWISRLQLDTYEREVERYGGPAGMTLAERVFHVDSDAVLAMLGHFAGDEGAEARWRLTLRGMDLLLTDLGFELETKREILRRARESFGREFQADTTYLKHQLNDKLRQQRKELEVLLDAGHDAANPLRPGFDALRARSERLAPVFGELKNLEQAGQLTRPIADLAFSYLHIHANRLLRSAQRAQELVLYHFLDRIYDSWAARLRKAQ